MNKLQYLAWQIIRGDTRQASPSQLKSELQELTATLEIVSEQVTAAVLRAAIKQIVEKEVRRYLKHRERIERFKRTRRWPAI